MRENFDKRRTLPMFAEKVNYDSENGLIASYKVSKLIAKCGKTQKIGEQLILKWMLLSENRFLLAITPCLVALMK